MRGSDVATLEKFVNLPYVPVAVRRETESRPGGNDWSLSALITFTPEQVGALAKAAPSSGLAKKARVDSAHLKDWFPESVRRRYETHGETVEVGALVTEATAFFAPNKSPLIHGDALLFEADGLVYLSLYTM